MSILPTIQTCKSLTLFHALSPRANVIPIDSNEHYTRLNTMRNRTAQYTNDDGPDHDNTPDTDSEPPTPPSKSSSLIARLVTPTPQFRIPPPRLLPPIPGPPVTAVKPNSTVSLVDSSREHKDDDKRGSPHVRFRSPVASARECSPLPSNNGSGPLSNVIDHHYPPSPPHPDLYGVGSDESFDPYKYHRPSGHTS